MTAVWESDVQPAGKRIVLLALADSANDEGVCWPNMATIARKAGVGLSSARKACAALEEEGLLEREYRKTTTAAGNETNKSSIYTINAEKLAARVQAPAQIERPPARSERTPPPGTSGAPAQIERHNRKENPQVEPKLNQDAAKGDAAPADGLFSAEEIREANGFTVKANDVVAAYVDAYRSAHQGHDPLQADIRKVAGTAARMIKDAAVKTDVLLRAATALGRTQFTDLAGQYRRSLQGGPVNQDPTRGYYRAEQKNAYVPPAGETPEEANARVQRHLEWLEAYNNGTATLADRPE
jgi:hypothetical protein